MPRSLGFGCTCGQLRGAVADVGAGAVTHVLCHCRDCRSAYTHLGRADPGQVGILQTAQAYLRIGHGAEALKAFRLSPRGALRWHAGCCDTPLFVTPLWPRLTHVGVNADRLDDPTAAGRPVAEAFVPTAGGGFRHRGAGRMVMRMLQRMAAGNLNGDWRHTPFFGDDAAPLVVPRILTREERATALAGLRV